MTRHIGIVACSAEGAALCYRTICAEGAEVVGPHDHPEISLHTHSLARYVRHLDQGDWEGVGELMLSSAEKLADAGADFLICPDNTIHQAMEYVAPRSPLPWLHIAEVVADEAARRGFRSLALTGTRWLVDSDVYPEKLAARGIECVRPDEAEREDIQRIIMDELVYGVFRDESVERFRTVIARMQADGCDAVVLGCTEIPLIMNDGNSPLPTLDSTRLLARAALRESARIDSGESSRASPQSSGAVEVDYQELDDALMWTGGGGEAYIDRETGRIHWAGDEDVLDLDEAEIPDDLEDPERFIPIPHKNELDLGKHLAMDFAARALPERYRNVQACFRGPGAYGQFKDLLADEGKLEAWYRFENEATEQALRDWCEAEGFRLLKKRERTGSE